ncbi:MAG: RNA-directed DNA polymerase [Planctomycetes bacterium]|nr:RNA-directed DNA polymerase [Planctomycetota bacterium]
MGIFDWLFGKKKKAAYGADWDTTQSAPSYQGPANQPAPEQREPFINAPARRTKRTRTWGLKWRQQRSKHPLESVPNEEEPFSLWSNPFKHHALYGGTEAKPSKGGSAARIEALGLPNLENLDELAALLGETRNNLLHYIIRDRPGDRHYVARDLPKKSGGTRMLLVPKPRLKAIQRKLNAKLIRRLPLNPAAHGFRRSHDVLSGASVHVARSVVISVDIEAFFPSLTFRRVSGFLRSIGYSRGIATALANLMTIRPCNVAGIGRTADTRYPQLPQGAPTSPGIANAICWRMDKRLSALARKFGGDYTRYADDLTFSGFDEMAKGAGRLLQLVRKIVKTEGLALNEKKTRIMRKGRQQRVTGVVVNQQTNVSRREFDKLKAILHNCIKHGPGGQNRESVPDFKEHLRGRIAHISHIGPERGRKLKAMFDQIRW